MSHGGKRKGAGCPVGSHSDSATLKVEVRVTKHEKAVFQARAAALGLSVSEYVKLCCISG